MPLGAVHAAYVVVSFNDDGSASMGEVYWMPRAEAVRCVASHNQRTGNRHTFAVLSTDMAETRRLLDLLFPRLVVPPVVPISR